MSSSGSYGSGGGSVGDGILTITGNTGGAVSADGARNIDVLGVNVVTVDGTPASNLQEIGLTQGTDGQLIIGATGSDPIWANLVSGDGTITFSLGANSIDMRANLGAIGVTTLTGDTGVPAVPVAGNINVLSGTAPYTNINTESATPTGDDITIRLNDRILWPETNAGGTAGAIFLDGSRFMHAAGGSALANCFLGQLSGDFSITGLRNTGIGDTSLTAITSGTDNTAVGSLSLSALTDAIECVAVGSGALGNANGNENTAVGTAALLNLTTGTTNIALGNSSGSNYTGAESTNICIGSLGVLGESNTTRIGTSGAHTAAYFEGIFGSSLGATNRVVQIDNTGKLGTTTGTNGQLLIGGGTAPIWANLTAGTGISIVNGANSISISATGAFANTFTADTGSAMPAVGNLNVIGGSSGLIETTGSGSTLTADIVAGTKGYVIMATGVSDPVYGQITSSNNSIVVDRSTSGIIDLSTASESVGGSFLAILENLIGGVTGDGTEYYLGESGGAGAILTEIFDDDNNFFPGDGAGTPASFTAPIDGRYFFCMSVELSPSSPKNMTIGEFYIRTNNRVYNYCISPAGCCGNPEQSASVLGANGVTIQWTVIADMDAGHTATFSFSTIKRSSFPAKTVGVGPFDYGSTLGIANNTTYITGYLVDAA